MISTIAMELFGGLRVWVNGKLVLDTKGTPGDAWRLLCCLALHHAQRAPLPRHDLVAALWPNRQPPEGTLETAAQTLCQKLGAAEGEHPVLCVGDTWLIDTAIQLQVDAFELVQACTAVSTASGAEKDARLARLLALYKGPLLPGLANESWVVPQADLYRQTFVDCAGNFCFFLQQEERYNELLQVSTEASRAEPLEEELLVYSFRALAALKMYKAIVPAYHRVARALSDELGAMPCREIQDIYIEAAAQLDATSQDVMLIREDLEQALVQQAPEGPLVCTYDVLQYLYRMAARTSERTGLKTAILLLSLRGEAGGLFPTARVVSQGMHRVQGLLTTLLRKSDIVARYTRSQILLLLSVDKQAGLHVVRQRIEDAARPALEVLEMELAITEIEPV